MTWAAFAVARMSASCCRFGRRPTGSGHNTQYVVLWQAEKRLPDIELAAHVDVATMKQREVITWHDCIHELIVE